MTALSILIRTFNSGKTLQKVVEALRLGSNEELIVVDSGSTDDTLAIAKKFSAQIVLADGPFNYSKSLNCGFRAAKYDWVLVLSSHATPQTDRFLEFYRQEIPCLPQNTAVVYGASTTTGQSGLDSADPSIRFYNRENLQEIVSLCGNGNALYRKTAWQALGFDENIRTAEDKIWLHAILELGYEFAFLPSVCTLNQNQASLRYMYKKGFGDAKAAARPPGFRPMNLYQLGGALKNQCVKRLRGKIDQGNWLRYSAHILGQFFGSYGAQNNHPNYQ